MMTLTIILVIAVVALYALGACLMRGLLKATDCESQDDIKEVLIWPYTVAMALGELIINRNFKW